MPFPHINTIATTQDDNFKKKNKTLYKARKIMHSQSIQQRKTGSDLKQMLTSLNKEFKIIIMI